MTNYKVREVVDKDSGMHLGRDAPWQCAGGDKVFFRSRQ